MARKIAISDDVFARLSKLARPFVDREPEDVIRRLLDQNEARSSNTASSLDEVMSGGIARRSAESRAPRQRGATVQIEDHKIDAISVRTLYEEALKFLVAKHRSSLRAVIPLRTSRERYLIANKAVHPSGNHFVIPVEHDGFCMEAHKDYKNAIAHLGMLCNKLGLSLRHLV
jgi:predicted CopG family antitoxin